MLTLKKQLRNLKALWEVKPASHKQQGPALVDASQGKIQKIKRQTM